MAHRATVDAAHPAGALEQDQVPADRGVGDTEPDGQVGDAHALAVVDEPRDALAALVGAEARGVEGGLERCAHLFTPMVSPWIR